MRKPVAGVFALSALGAAHGAIARVTTGMHAGAGRPRFGGTQQMLVTLGLFCATLGAIVLLRYLRRQPQALLDAATAGDAPVSNRLAALRSPRADGETDGAQSIIEAQPDEPVTTDPHPQPVVLARRARSSAVDWEGARSWFGGLPRLGELEWPRNARGAPLPFAAQIDLAELAAARPGNPLPDNGWLAFFVGLPGAVVHVPGARRLPPITPAPDGLPAAYLAGGGLFPAQQSAAARPQFPFWPVELAAIDLPPHLHDWRDPARAEAILQAIDRAMSDRSGQRGEAFSMHSACCELGWQEPPLWWHSVMTFADQLAAARDLAVRAAEQGEPAPAVQREGLAVALRAFAHFTEGRKPWQRLEEEERDQFAQLFTEMGEHFPDLLAGHVSADLSALSTHSVIGMITGDAEAFAALPGELRELINRDFRLPSRFNQQIFGLGAGTPPEPDDDAVLLLQLVPDAMMHWQGSGTSVLQFRIPAADLAEARWDRAAMVRAAL